MLLFLGTTPAVQRSMSFASVALDGVSRAKRVRDYASGKSINAARVAHTLGERVTCLGLIGGARGARIARDLDDAGVTHDFTIVRPETRLCVTVIDESAGTATELIEEAAGINEGDEAALLKRLGEHLTGANVLVLSGSLAPGISADFYGTCVDLATRAKVMTVVDAKGAALAAAVAEGATIVKPNRQELGETVGLPVSTDDELRAALAALHARGAHWIAVTDGAAGTTLSDGSDVWRVPTPRVDVVSAIGSGDSFAAGLAVGVARGLPFPDACALAAACGSANAMTAFAGHMERATVERLRREIAVSR